MKAIMKILRGLLFLLVLGGAVLGGIYLWHTVQQKSATSDSALMQVAHEIIGPSLIVVASIGLVSLLAWSVTHIKPRWPMHHHTAASPVIVGNGKATKADPKIDDIKVMPGTVVPPSNPEQ